MNARFALSLLLTAGIAAALGWWWGSRPVPAEVTSAPGAARVIKFYQSPMHPWITSPSPGKCTICGMDLVPVYEGEAGFDAGGDVVQLGAPTAAIIGVATTPVVTVANATRTVTVTGVIEDDDTRHTLVTAWTDARLEQLHVNAIGQFVTAGTPLVAIYSRELHVARQEFHALARQRDPSPSLLAASRTRLLQLGLRPAQLDELAASPEVSPTTTILAPTDGTVIARGPTAYVGANLRMGDLLFELADLRQMWVVLEVPETDLTPLRAGLPVTLHIPGDPDSPRPAQITFLEPNIDSRTRTARARVVVDNPDGHLRHRQSLTAELHLPLDGGLLVPRSAVLFTRAEPVVFVDRDGAYAPRTVRLISPAADEGFIVTHGLRDGDRVVTAAGLLVEGQAQLAMGPPKPTAEAMDASGAMSSPSADIAAFTPVVLAAADAAAALAADDLAGYVAVRPALRDAWNGYLAAAPDAGEGPLSHQYAALVDGPNLRTARRAFEPFSTSLADLALAAGIQKSGTVHVFQCPMTPVLGTGRWVQRGGELQNPFFGAAMLTCGEEIR